MAEPRGDRLYALVEQYARLGDHHTGTAVDEATRAWFAAALEARGARVEMSAYEFEQYVAEASVTADRRPLSCIPLFYSGVGEVDTCEPCVASLSTRGGVGVAPNAAIDDLLAEARADGATVVVLATDPPDGTLVAVNRPVVDAPGPPGVLVAGRDLAALHDGALQIVAHARISRGSSANVVGSLGPPATPTAAPVVVTTPLTGWFGCAGERGTGIAVALELAAELGEDLPVQVVGTTGHEIGFLGLRRHLARAHVRPRLVVHLGAGAAAGDDGRTLGTLRIALVDGMSPTVIDALTEALGPAQLTVAPWDPAVTEDVSEGALWRGAVAPLLSVVGWFETFHTRDDVPAAVTSPEVLETVTLALARAVACLR